jgi:hypothetical protein
MLDGNRWIPDRDRLAPRGIHCAAHVNNRPVATYRVAKMPDQLNRVPVNARLANSGSGRCRQRADADDHVSGFPL